MEYRIEVLASFKKEAKRLRKHYASFIDDYEKLLGWIDAYDLDSQIDTLAERPFLIWHGTEDEKIPYERRRPGHGRVWPDHRACRGCRHWRHHAVERWHHEHVHQSHGESEQIIKTQGKEDAGR